MRVGMCIGMNIFVLQVFQAQWWRELGYERGCVYWNVNFVLQIFPLKSGGGCMVMREGMCMRMNILYYRFSHHSGGGGLVMREGECIRMNILYNRFSHHSHFQSIDEKEDDVESGRGASLPQSPHSVEGAIGGPSSTLLPSEVSFTYFINFGLNLSEVLC